MHTSLNGIVHFIKEHYLFLLLFLVGTLLRFDGFTGAEFHHDELSALLRTRFETFEELLLFGIKIDGHPGLVQAFLWWWVQTFGITTFWIKLPFVVLACASIVLVYFSVNTLFDRRAALVATAFFAVSDYAILYSLWIRPYAVGSFFVLFSFYGLLVAVKRDKKWGWAIFGLGATLAGYTHYFALLQVILIALTGYILLLESRHRVWFLIAGIVATLLWLPHLNITLHHLQLKGIGDWLRLPEWKDGWNLLTLSFNHSLMLWGTVGLAAFMAVLVTKNSQSFWKREAVLLTLGALPFIIAFIYSYSVSSLLHAGTMYFSFPFVLMAAGGLFTSFNRSLAGMFAFWVVLVGSILHTEQDALKNLNTKTEFQNPVDWFHTLSAEYRREGQSISAFFDLRPDAAGWLHHHGISSFDSILLFESLPSEHEWVKHLHSVDTDHLLLLVTAASPSEYLGLAQTLFPHVEEMRCYNSATAYLLGRDNPSLQDQALLAVDYPMQQLAGESFSNVFHFSARYRTPFTYLIVQASFKGREVGNAKLVLEGETSKGDLWKSQDLSKYITSNRQGQAVLALDLRDHFEADEEFKLRAYLWNEDQGKTYLESISARLIPSNPIRYGLVQPIDDKTLVLKDGSYRKSLFTLKRKI